MVQIVMGRMRNAEQFDKLLIDECGVLEIDLRPGASIKLLVLRDVAARNVAEECELRFVYVLDGRISLESLHTKMTPGPIQNHGATINSPYLQQVLSDRAVDEQEADEYSHFTIEFERGKLDVVAKAFNLDVVKSITTDQ